VKGIIFNLLEDVVIDAHGEAAWDQLLADSGLDGAYTSLGSYPDADLDKLVAAASELRGTDPDEIVRWYGREALPLLAKRYPDFFTPHESTRPFLLTLNDIIHPEIRKIYPGAQAPQFDFDASEPQVLRMGYESTRGLCAFGEGLIEGAADHYGEQVHLTQPVCVRNGDPKCVFEITFSS